MRVLAAAAVLCCLWSGTAQAQTIRLLQSLPVFFTCLAQEPEMAEAHWKETPQDADTQIRVEQLRRVTTDSPWAACVRNKQWVSKPFCSDLLTSKQRRDTAAAMDKHEDERRDKLKPLYDYFQASFPDGGRPAVPPPCPE